MFTLENDKAKKSNILDIKIKNYGECGFCTDKYNQETLKIPWNIWSQWMYISQRMGEKEWGAVFWVKDNTITSFRIPTQEVGSVDCEFKEELGGDGIIHSHHDMGAFHSRQDDHHARNLYTYSIVIANSKGSIATKRIKLPCKGFGYSQIQIKLEDLPEIDLSRITEKERLYSAQKELGFSNDNLSCDRCTVQDCQNCAHVYTGQFSCDNCISFKCKDCQQAKGMDIPETLPFCDFCEDYGLCLSCDKLTGYLRNYPQDRKNLEHLIVNKPEEGG